MQYFETIYISQIILYFGYLSAPNEKDCALWVVSVFLVQIVGDRVYFMDFCIGCYISKCAILKIKRRLGISPTQYEYWADSDLAKFLWLGDYSTSSLSNKLIRPKKND